MNIGAWSRKIRNSIPLKICCSIFIVEAALLFFLGYFYALKFNKEIDDAVHQKMLLPAVLLSARALNYDAVSKPGVMSDLTQENVVDAFIVNPEGRIFYGTDNVEVNNNFQQYLDPAELRDLSSDLSTPHTFNFVSKGGASYISALYPITFEEKILGSLYLRIDGRKIYEKKIAVATLFFLGALTTILITTILEAFFVYKLVVPRLRKTSEALGKIEDYHFSTRIKEYGPPDELGMLMKKVNSMICQIEKYMIDFVTAEKKYTDLFLSSREGIFKLGEKGELLDGNPALAELLGFSDMNDMLEHKGRNFTEYLNSPQDSAVLKSKLIEHGSFQDCPVEIKRQDGKVITASLSAHSLFDNQGRLLYYEGFVFDITKKTRRAQLEQKRREAEAVAAAKSELAATLKAKNNQLEQTLTELKATQTQLLQSEKMAVLGMTAGGVAHDLNNILSGIIGYPEFLLMELEEGSSLRKPLEAILASGKRAAAVVSDMLTLSKGAVDQNTAFSLNDVVRDYLESLEFNELRNSRHFVTVTTMLADHQLPIRCSDIHIQKVVMNLVINGMEAIEQTGELTISTSASSELPDSIKNTYNNGDSAGTSDYAVLAVSDTGNGISPSDMGQIFEPFYTRKVMGKSGTGLGLTIVQNLVHEHNGYIDLQSSDSGTTFTVYFPITADTKAIENQSESVDTDLSGTGTILFVDDEQLQRDLGTNILTSFGYTVNAVASGEEALIFLKENEVDLLVLDMIMAPGISGLETYKRVIADRPGQKAIIASGFSADNDVKEALALGVSRFISKPYLINSLGKAIKDVFTS